MSRRKRIAVSMVFLLFSVTGLWSVWHARHRRLPPLRIGIWYWHSPFRLTHDEAQQLRAAGITQLYIRSGTFVRRDEGVRLMLRQKWMSDATNLATHLVFNFDYTVVRGFNQMNTDQMALDIGVRVRKELAHARLAGLRPVGVQFDFDCATRSLPRYARLLKRLHSSLIGGGAFKIISITALPTWYGSRAVREVADAVDFMTPQYYEPRLGPTLDRYATISCLPLLEKGLQQAGRIGRPFYVGIPAYGHALMYDDHGALVGLYRDMNVIEATHHRAFHIARAYAANADGKPASPETAIGENMIDLVATQAGETGRGLGYHLIYDLPTSDLVAQHIALIRAQQPPECQGVILFCLLEPDGTLALPLSALNAGLGGKPAHPDVKVRVTVHKAPWGLIETSKKTVRSPIDFIVSVTNSGVANSFLATDALTLTLYFDRPGLDDVNPRDFDGMATGFVDPMESGKDRDIGWQRCSPVRANMLRFKRFHLSVGETARAGPITVPDDGATRVWGTWSVRDQNGFRTLHGDIAPVSLN